MPQIFQLHIPEPCHQDWNKMTPVERGKFCGSCKKTVVDFTSMSDSDLVAFFRERSNGSVCGRLADDQLNKDLRMPQKRLPWLKYLFQFLFPVFILSCKGRTQGKVMMGAMVEVSSISSIQPNQRNTATEEQDTLTNRLYGKVIDSNGNGIPGASILIKGTSSGTITNDKGEFSISLPDKKRVTLFIMSIGFKPSRIRVDRNKINEKVEVKLKETGYVLGQIAFIKPTNQ